LLKFIKKGGEKVFSTRRIRLPQASRRGDRGERGFLDFPG